MTVRLSLRIVFAAGELFLFYRGLAGRRLRTVRCGLSYLVLFVGKKSWSLANVSRLLIRVCR